jgi:hypothetical protein
MVFIIMGIDQMHPRLREVLLNEQDLLTKCREPHGIVYYFSCELTTYRRGLKFFHVPPAYRNARQTHAKLTQLFQQTKRVVPEIRIICGKEGSGKFPDLIFSKNDLIAFLSRQNSSNLHTIHEGGHVVF